MHTIRAPRAHLLAAGQLDEEVVETVELFIDVLVHREAVASVVLSTLSDPPHPQPALLGAKKELIKYERDDGVALTGTLHTPAGWTEADGPLPTILWAYPREFKSKASASQVRGSEHTFTMVGWERLRGTKQSPPAMRSDFLHSA